MGKPSLVSAVEEVEVGNLDSSLGRGVRRDAESACCKVEADVGYKGSEGRQR